MAWRFVTQPDGRLALWSDIVDNFTYFNLTEEEAYEIALEEYDMGKREGREKVERGKARDVEARGGWNEGLNTIRVIHGQEAVDKFLEGVRSNKDVE